jgi:hypothetical protein
MPPASITYGTPLSSKQLDASASVPGTFAYSPTLGTMPAAGTQKLSVTFTPNEAKDYNVASATVPLEVDQATPAITWQAPGSITYGAPLSAAQLDAAANVPGTFTYSPALGSALAAGTQNLSVTFIPTDAKDYNIASATVPLEVDQATPGITWQAPASITYGAPLSAAQLDAAANVPGTFTYSPALGSALAAGTQNLSATFTPTDAKDYNIASATVPLEVDQATPAITWQAPASITYGVPLSAAQLDAAANVPGTFTYSPALGSVLAVGTQNLSVTFTPNDAKDYVTATASVSIGVFDSIITVSPNVVGDFRTVMTTGIHVPGGGTRASGSPDFIALSQLAAQHIRVQATGSGIPQVSPDTWRFSVLDSTMQVLLGFGDHSPYLELARAPSFMYMPDNAAFADASYSQLSKYAQNLVRYYNKGGFFAPDGFHVSPSNTAITWWGIMNEPNGTGLDPEQYVALYNTVVPSMQAVDPTLKFIALELADTSAAEIQYLPTFVNEVNAPVDAVAIHFYSSWSQNKTDASVLATIPPFISRMQYVYSQLQTRDDLAQVPVWITESNVTATPPDPNVIDARGSSVFDSAWRPYLFSKLASIGVAALYQFNFDGNPQYGEIDCVTGRPRLSYWVDTSLSHYFPALLGAKILQTTNSDSADIEPLVVVYPDGSAALMVANHAVASLNDNNGQGAPRTVSLDVSTLGGGFSSAAELTIDANTDVINGPEEMPVPIAQQYQITFNGYGVWLLKLTP